MSTANKTIPDAAGDDLLARNMIDVHGAEAAAIARGNARSAALAGQATQAKSWIAVLGIIQQYLAGNAPSPLPLRGVPNDNTSKEEQQMRRGLYRIHGSDGRSDEVRAEDDGIEMPLAESVYRARGYLPPIDDLPWQEDYARGALSSDGVSSIAEAAKKATRQKERQEFLDRFRKQ